MKKRCLTFLVILSIGLLMNPVSMMAKNNSQFSFESSKNAMDVTAERSNERYFGWWWPEFPGRFEPFFDISYDVDQKLTDDMNEMNGVALADFNNDEICDIAVSWKNTDTANWGRISILLNQGTRQDYDRVDVFEHDYTYGTIHDLDAADYDNDGDIDLLFTYSEHDNEGLPLKLNGTGKILLNDGDMSFSNERQVFWHGPGDPVNRDKNRINPQVASADFNNDGAVDFIVGDNTGLVSYYQNDGNGFFSCVCTSDFGYSRGFSWGVAAADYNNDELIDFIVTEFHSQAEGDVYLKYNDGSETCFNHSSFHKIAMVPDYDNLSFFTTLQPQALGNLVPIDYDKNGRMDFVFAGIGYVLLYMQVEPNVFEQVTVCRLPAENIEKVGGFDFEPDFLLFGGFDVADVDNDGWEDIIIGGSNHVIETLYGNHTFIDIVFPDGARYIKDNMIMAWFLPSYFCLKNGISLVQGDVTIVANELQPLSKVEFYLDDKLVCTDETSPFEWEWNTFSFGMHMVKAKAYDTEGNKVGFDESKILKLL